MMAFLACNDEKKESELAENTRPEKAAALVKEYGFLLNDYEVVRDTVRSGDSFGIILDNNGLSPEKVFQVVEKVRDTFNPRRMVIGDPYVILKKKDTAGTPVAFVYEKDLINYTVIDLRDSISAYTAKKPVTISTKTISGVIESSLSEAIEAAGLNYLIAHEMINIYQWSIDFFRLQEGDRFKLVFKERYINDSIYAGIEKIEAAIMRKSPIMPSIFHWTLPPEREIITTKRLDHCKVFSLKPP